MLKKTDKTINDVDAIAYTAGPGLSGALLAKGAGVPVLPISHNSGKYWKRRGLIKHPGKIVFSIGSPILTKGKSIEEINREAQTWIESEIRSFE